MNSVRDILEAIRALPLADRLRLAELLAEELGSAPVQELPAESQLVLKHGFHVFTGPVDPAELDHRIDREKRLDHLAGHAVVDALSASAGAWSDDAHPELQTREDVVRFVRGLRAGFDR